jgi:hypothetical protein
MESLAILEPSLTLESWGQEVARLFEERKESRRKIDSNSWQIGDELLSGEKQFEEAAMEEAIRATGHSKSTLWDFMRVARTFPRSRRVASLSWSHHKEVANHLPGEEKQDNEKQDKALAEAVQRKLPIKRFRAKLENKENQLEKEEEEKRLGRVKFVRIPVGPEIAKVLRRLGNARDKRPEQLLSAIVTQHFAERMEAITKEVEAWEANRRESTREVRTSRKADKANLEALRIERKRFEDYFFDLRNRTGQPVPRFIKGYLEKEFGHARWLEIPVCVFEEVVAKVKEAGDDPHEQVKRLQTLQTEGK